jgi:hypothetical protein
MIVGIVVVMVVHHFTAFIQQSLTFDIVNTIVFVGRMKTGSRRSSRCCIRAEIVVVIGVVVAATAITTISIDIATQTTVGAILHFEMIPIIFSLQRQ